MKRRDYADDCVHLHACRRLCILAEQQTGRIVVRHCLQTSCEAYQKGPLYDSDQMRIVINGAAEDGARGYDGLDLLPSDYLN